MKKALGILSSILYGISLFSYVLFLATGSNVLIIVVGASTGGFILALFSEKGVLKKIGLIGNGLILIISVIIPLIVTTFFWNSP
jgi:hypothetical protein